MGLTNKIHQYAKLVMLSHFVFSLGFGLFSMLIAAQGLPSLETFVWILVALFGARNGANAQNRIIDRKIDEKNQRLSQRPIPGKQISKTEAWTIMLVCYALFILAAGMLNPLALMLSPVALALFTLYSYTKRFTWMCHVVLGIASAGAPVGAWIAVTGRLDWVPFIIGTGVLFWVSGFDVLYAIQDQAFDEQLGLYSIPRVFGEKKAYIIAAGFHLVTFLILCVLPLFTPLGWVYYVGVIICGGLLMTQHLLVHRPGKGKIAYYTLNQWVGISVLLFGGLDMLLR